MQIRFLGAAGEVTGSCHLIEIGDHKLLLDCGLIQGSTRDEARNRDSFAFDPATIDAVVLSHAHVDHSGRLPLLVKRGYTGPVYTHHACRDLCRIMLKDAAYLNERDAEWENRKRERKGLKPVAPLYTTDDAKLAMRRFKGLSYGERRKIFPNVSVRLSDAGHILGSSIIEVWLREHAIEQKLVFSGDLGHRGTPILRDPTPIDDADLVLMESTYGDRLHRPHEETSMEIRDVLREALKSRGNILIPAFAIGRSQELLYFLAKNHQEWKVGSWQIFLDSPLAIQATEVYARHAELYDPEAADLWRKHCQRSLLPNLHFSRTPKQSMALNSVASGAIIIAGSGMCTGGRIRHHLKHNVWRKACHVIIAGFQARGTTGRALVDGARCIRLWGETIRVAAKVHTIGGLSAHADQDGLCRWYARFRSRPPVALVHGEAVAIDSLAKQLIRDFNAPVHIPQLGQTMDITDKW